MKTNSTYYEAWALNGGSKLAIIADTLQEMRDAVDSSNNSAKKLGYSGEQRLIVRVETSREVEGGRFVRSSKEETYIETYPEEV